VVVAPAEVLVTEVVDVAVTALVTVFEAVAELSVDDPAVVELEIDAQVLVAVIEALLDWKAAEAISPQPAKKEVAIATNSRVAKATLNLFKANYKVTKNTF